MEFKKDFFCDEVRDGFMVPAMVKEAWGAQLEVLSVIDSICSHNYYLYIFFHFYIYRYNK